MTPEATVAETELRRDPLSGRLVVVAPGRSRRPGAFNRAPIVEQPGERDTCPFCAGHEEQTPPETFRIPDGDVWQVRVVPNLYPAFSRQEVVIHTPRHLHSIAQLSGDEVALVAAAWQRRARAHEDGYLHAFVNEGSAAGASLPHTHSQLVWLGGAPPEILREAGQNPCPLCALGDDDLVIAERDGVVLRVAWAARMPYHMLVSPREHLPDPWAGDLLATGLSLAAEGLRRLHGIEGLCPANLWLHHTRHWHIEVLPRVTILAGLELGAGIYVNPLSPETTAEALRG